MGSKTEGFIFISLFFKIDIFIKNKEDEIRSFNFLIIFVQLRRLERFMAGFR